MYSATMTARLLVLVGALLSGNVMAVDYFPLQNVQLLHGPFQQARDRNIDYMMAMDADRLLAPYLEEAGLPPRAEKYGNWENTGLNGHVGGHYVSALSLALAATGRADVRERLNYVLGELRRAQLANGNGYLGGVPDADRLWRELPAGEIQAELFSLNGYWVPWYNLHKIFAGLRDAWLVAGNPLARTMLIEWADWAAGLVAALDDGQLQAMLVTEHGGMNEVFADVAAITGEPRYLGLARRFSHRDILDPLLNGEDTLTGLHANTQIPKVVGFQRIAQQAGDTAWHEAARFFWTTVVERRSVAIGGNSVREHFNERDDFSPMIDDVQGPETCNTHNMLRLTRLLYADSPQQAYADYYERALYNHILSSQDPLTGGLVYFTPMRPQHYRVYSQVDEGMWCCVGSGIENHSRYGEFIYARDGDALHVNLFIPSVLNWSEKGVVLRQETRFPDQSFTQLVFETDAEIVLKLRYPGWASAAAGVQINGKPESVQAVPGSVITLRRQWRKGDTVRLALPMNTRLEQMPGGSDYYAILHGPVVLSAPVEPFENETLDFLADASRMGHIPDGALCPLERSPTLISGAAQKPELIERVDDEQLRFRLNGVTAQGGIQELELLPFFRVHRSRYMLYWPLQAPE